MSNSNAIAVVTGALQHLLQPAVGAAVTNANVGFNRPDKDPSALKGAVVNVYLYQVTPNAAYRNADLPTRRAGGTSMQRPQVALDLHYLFTFHGDEGKLEPQRLLGAVAGALQNQPLLSVDDISKAEQHLGVTPTGLADQIERVKFTPTALSLEEFSKLWSVFFQVEYVLSAAYQASLVLIESNAMPQEALPVQTRNLYTFPFRAPAINQVASQSGAASPIVTGTTLSIQGQQLRGASTFVLLEGQEFTPSSVTDGEILLPLPPGVHAGVKSLQVVQKTWLGTPPALHRGVESNGAPFVLYPTISQPTAQPALNPPGSADVTLSLKPNIGTGQRAVLVLNDPLSVPPASYVSPAVIAAAESNQIVINIVGVPTGLYLARVQIDGAESLLTAVGNQFTGPKVQMP
jgi:hypothetical protein